MSSILDALKKLEQEKAQSIREAALTPVTAEQELIGHRTMHERLTIRMSPPMAIASVAIFSLLLVLLSVGLSAMLLRDPARVTKPDAATMTVASAPAVATQSAQVPAATQPSPEVPAASRAAIPPAAVEKPLAIPAVKPAVIDDSPAAAEPIPVKIESKPDPKPNPPASEPSEAVAPNAAVLSETIPSAAETAPGPPPAEDVAIPGGGASEVSTEALPDWSELAKVQKPVAVEPSLPLTVASRPPAFAAPRADAGRETEISADPPARAALPDSIRELPILSPGIKMRYGLEKLRVNMVKPVGPSNPYGQAVINMIPTYEGDPILNTTAKLIKVESHGVAIEIASTGARYYVDF